MDYLEFHLADHCNLNCSGCTHYAPYAEKRFADVEEVRRDFGRLKELFANIRHIRIMGGEPFLHSEVEGFVRLTREAFPKSSIRVVTNGLKLLEKGGGMAKILSCLKECGVGIDWTCYPPVAGRKDDIRKICEDAGVSLRISENDTFWARLKVDGGVNPAESFRWCRKRIDCPLLDSGRIYLCAQAHFADYYNRAAGTKIPVDEGIDIYKASAKEILLYLMRPSQSCAYCDAGARYFAWKGDAKPEDWLR